MSASPVPIETLLEHRPWVRAVAAAVVRDPNVADDVEQEAWLVALTAPPQHAGSLRGWLGAVVRNRARRSGRGESRRARREAVAARDEATRSTADLAEIADTHRRVVQAVVELDEPYRGTILLRFFEGLSIDEVARRTGAPLETTRARLRRGIARLRERLSRELGVGDRPWQHALAPLLGTAPTAGVPAATSATTTSKLTGGFISMAGKGTIAATGAALVVGTAAGWWIGAGGRRAEEPPDVARLDARDRPSSLAGAAPARGSRREEPRLAELESELRDARAEADELRRKLADRSASDAAAAPDSAPSRVGSAILSDRFAKLADVDWKAVGRSLSTMSSLLAEFAATRAAGGKPSPEKFGEMEKQNGALVAAALKGVQDLPGTFANSSFTHPAFVVNAIVATLESAGTPLTAAESTALERLAREFCDEDARRLAGYDASTLALQKIVDEADLRRRFADAALAALREQQRDTLSPPSTRGLVGVDLFGGDSLVLGQCLHPLPFKEGDVESLTSDVLNALDSKLRFSESQRPVVRAQIAEWLRDQPMVGAGPPTRADARLPVEHVRVAARRTLALLRGLIADGRLEARQVDAVRAWEDALMPKPAPRD